MAKKSDANSDRLEALFASGKLDAGEAEATSAPEISVKPIPAAKNRIVIHPQPDDAAYVEASGPKRAETPRSRGLYGPRKDNHERRWLEWLARFGDKPKDEIVASDWSREFRDFVGFVTAQGWIEGADSEDAFSFPRDEALEIAQQVQSGIESFVEKDSFWRTPELSSLQYTLSRGLEEKATLLPYAGKFRDAILLGIVHLLGQHGHRLRRCEATDCSYKTASGEGRLFFAAKRQIYCSEKCYDRDSMRKFIESLGGPEKYAAYRAEKYKERTEARKKMKAAREKIARRKVKK